MRAFPCTVRNISPIQCLTGRVPKVDGFINFNDIIGDTQGSFCVCLKQLT